MTNEELDALLTIEVNKRANYEAALVDIQRWADSVPASGTECGWYLGRIAQIVYQVLKENE